MNVMLCYVPSLDTTRNAVSQQWMVLAIINIYICLLFIYNNNRMTRDRGKERGRFDFTNLILVINVILLQLPRFCPADACRATTGLQ
mmetsp:Transcript_14088/g.21720  ORF Transcript_14088/g.21720 Transcript_14088/m.21720 type:complete len:87 (-) Transcript_14088:4-264(-)